SSDKCSAFADFNGDIKCRSGIHSFGTWQTVKNALCSTNGEKKRTCTLCGYIEYGSIPATRKLLFDFGTSGTGIYKDKAYGKYNFARANYWYSPKTKEKTTKQVTATVTGKQLKLTTAATKNNNSSQYIETSASATQSKRPLSYKLKAGDIIKVRYKVTKYAKNNSNNKENPTLTVYGWNGTATNYKKLGEKEHNLNTKGNNWAVAEWTVPATYKLSTLRLTFKNFCGSTVLIDYIYVGPKASAPK
ncbi:MAG: hypothetical protein IJ072_02610, partial [Oscillospiraceae bacterium]|nr:hypothetical protein [Oscillospiraceae bacterium]